MFRYPSTPKTKAMEETRSTSNFKLRLPASFSQGFVALDLSSGLDKLRHLRRHPFRFRNYLGRDFVAENG
jgi:hypothetical protein